MSTSISTIDDSITINSFADKNGFGLNVIHKDKGKLDYMGYTWEEYGPLLKELWINYLAKNEKPKLGNYIISNNGLIEETLHYIAPTTWYFPITDGKLPILLSDRESFIYWLKSNQLNIHEKIGYKESNYLNKSLDEILKINLERKEQ